MLVLVLVLVPVLFSKWSRELRRCLSIYLYIYIYLSTYLFVYMHMSMYMLIISSMERRCSKQKPQYVSHPSEVHFCLLPLLVQNLRK